MRRSDAEALLKDWWVTGEKLLAYSQDFMPTEYIVVKKLSDIEFMFNEKESTVQIPNFDMELLIKLMCNGSLKITESFWSSGQALDRKTGGCTCGSWIVRHARHEDKCGVNNKFRSPIGWDDNGQGD